MDIALEIVLKTRANSDLVYAWRSDVQARKMSLHKPKTENEFWHAFSSRYFVLKDLPALFALHEGRRVAFIAFDPLPAHANKSALVSIVVDPFCRGQGIGKRALKAALAYAKQQGYEELHAQIKPENKVSKHIFENAGFVFMAKESEAVEGKNVPLERYVAKLHKGSSKKGNEKVFIIAEAGSNWRLGNYERDLKMACLLIELAKDAGCDAIKFQTYRSNTIYAPGAGKSDYLSSSGYVEDIKSIFDDLSMPYEMIPELAKKCKSVGIEFMSSAFSKRDFQAIDPYVKRHKIASYEISHVRLLELAAKSKKPLILSTGASNVSDIEWALSYFYGCGGKEVTLLQCSAQYPAEPCGMNLRAIPWLKTHFHVPVGLSDHSFDPLVAPVAAVALGATCIEKHFTLDRRLVGPDHAFAIEPHELKEMVLAIRETEAMFGSGVKEILKEEKELYDFARRRVQVLSDIKKGEKFVEDKNVAILRPGKQKGGVHPRYMDEIIRAKAKRNLKMGEGVQFGDWV